MTPVAERSELSRKARGYLAAWHRWHRAQAAAQRWQAECRRHHMGLNGSQLGEVRRALQALGHGLDSSETRGGPVADYVSAKLPTLRRGGRLA